MYNDELKIRLLIKRYMDGRTTIEEEDFLMAWFASHPDVSEDLKDYQTMFTLLGSERIKKLQIDVPVHPYHNRWKRLRPMWVSLSVAASLALAFLVFHPSEDGTKERPALAEKTENVEKKPSVVETTVKASSLDSIKAEPAFTPSAPAVPVEPPKKRKYHKHLFEVAPPTVDLASTERALEQTELLAHQQAAPDIEQAAEEALQQTEIMTDASVTAALNRLFAQQEELINSLIESNSDTEKYTSHEIDEEDE